LTLIAPYKSFDSDAGMVAAADTDLAGTGWRQLRRTESLRQSLHAIKRIM
jgi:hypothetical protein